MNATLQCSELSKRREEVCDLLTRYARIVDSSDSISQWPTLFATEASYRVASRENLERGLPVVLADDASKARIHDRVTFITDTWRGHFNEYYQRHVLSPALIEDAGDGRLRATQSFVVYKSEQRVVGSTVLAVGEYRDEIVWENDQCLLSKRLTVVDTYVLPQYFVYPI